MVEWGRWALLNKSIQGFLHDSSIFLGGHKLRVVNCGNRCFSPPPIFMKSRTWWWFLTTFLFWFWHRFSFLSEGGKTQGQQSSASRILGVSGASENRAKWGRISLKNKHFSLPSFVLIATSPRKKKNAFLLWEFSSYFMEGMAETLSTSRDKTSELLCWHTIFALVFCTAMMWP